MIGNDAVDLLGVFKGAETVARLHMTHGDMQLHRRQRRRHGGVGVAEDEQQIRLLLHEYLFDLNEHFSGHLPVAAA